VADSLPDQSGKKQGLVRGCKANSTWLLQKGRAASKGAASRSRWREYGRADVKPLWAGVKVDGVAGPRTRAALHKTLLALSAAPAHSSDVQATVVEEKSIVPATVE